MKLLKKLFCKHIVKVASSCPFTGMTYIDCSACGKRLEVEQTIS